MPGQAIITIRDKQWQVSIADTPWELMQGLSGLPEILPRTGMFFDTGSTQIIQATTIFMLFPIDIAFFSETLVVTEVYRNIEPGYIVTSTTPARYFLEVNAGEAWDVQPNDSVTITGYTPPTATTSSAIELMVSVLVVTMMMKMITGSIKTV